MLVFNIGFYCKTFGSGYIFSLALYFVHQDYLLVASVKVESHFYDKFAFY